VFANVKHFQKIKELIALLGTNLVQKFAYCLIFRAERYNLFKEKCFNFDEKAS